MKEITMQDLMIQTIRYRHSHSEVSRLTQSGMAALCGVNKGVISLFETEQRSPRVINLMKILKVLNMDVIIYGGKMFLNDDSEPFSQVFAISSKPAECVLDSLPYARDYAYHQKYLKYIQKSNSSTHIKSGMYLKRLLSLTQKTLLAYRINNGTLSCGVMK